jgi:hypothetical protein
MSQSELEPKPIQVNVTIGDASNLPIYHVNVMNLRAGSDEFYFTLGITQPPEQTEIAALTVDGQVQVVAQPLFRFAISHDTMEKFLTLMAGIFDQQTTLMKQLHQQSSETSKKEVSGNE